MPLPSNNGQPQHVNDLSHLINALKIRKKPPKSPNNASSMRCLEFAHSLVITNQFPGSISYRILSNYNLMIVSTTDTSHKQYHITHPWITKAMLQSKVHELFIT